MKNLYSGFELEREDFSYVNQNPNSKLFSVGAKYPCGYRKLKILLKWANKMKKKLKSNPPLAEMWNFHENRSLREG